jgi:hypothetical protein
MKKILMAAAAVTALTAGSASALTLSNIKFSNIALTAASTGVTATSYGVADSVITTTSTNMVTTTAAATDNQITGTLSTTTGRFAPGGSGTTYVATYTLSGTANPVFNNVVQASNFSTNNAGTSCSVGSPNVVGGGAIGTNSVQISFNIPSSCSTTSASAYSPDGVTLKDIQIKTTAVGTITASLGFKTSLDNANYDGAPVSHPLVVTASPYVVSATADTTTTSLAVGAGATPYTSLKSGTGFDSTIGNLKYTKATAGSSIAGTTIYANLAASTLPTITADVNLNATSGNFSTIVPTIGSSTTGAVSSSNSATFNDTGLADSTSTGSSVTVSIASSNTTSLPAVQTYTASITPKLSSTTLVSVPASVTDKALQSIGLEGTNFVAPWIAGNQSPSSFVLRITNNAANATNPITLTLKSPTYNAGTVAGQTTCTSSTLPALTKINAGGELVLGVTEMTTCFGDFKRGDLLVTVQAPKDNLTAKARLTTASGQITEISLGGLSVTGESY